MSAYLDKLQHKFFTPVSGLSLAVTRFFFGLLIVWDVVLELFYGEATIYYKYIQPSYHIQHYLFTWVEPWPELWMAYLHFFALMIAGFCVMIGYYYRIAIVVTVLLFSYIFFIDMVYYLNHYYLMIVLGIMLWFLPANRVFSIDALRHPGWHDGMVPKWSVWGMRGLVEVFLLYAGLVKINHDWLRLEPLGTWLRNISGWHFFGPLTYYDWFIALGAYGAIALHLLGAPLLLYKKTRLWTFFAYCVFHLTNSYTFDIGIFPFLAIIVTLIFFDPDWPRQFVAWLIKKKDALKAHYAAKPTRPDYFARHTKFFMGGMIVFLIIQLLLPMRPLLFSGNTDWTELGHQFSWRMKLRTRMTHGGEIRIINPKDGHVWIIDPLVYMPRQHASDVGSNPQYLIGFVRFLEEEWRKKGFEDVQIYATVYSSTNYRKPALLVDPNKDLTTVEWTLFGDEDWILPMEEPLVHWKDRTW